MIIRDYAQCEMCGEHYILRAGVGNERHQIHSFDCKSCGLPISVVVRANPPNAHFKADENITFEVEENEDATVINLHPFFAFSIDEIHDRAAFPSTMYMDKILPCLRYIPGNKFQDVASQFDIPNAVSLWATVKNIFLLQGKTGQEKKISKLVGHYEKQRQKYFPAMRISTPKEVAVDFFDSLFYPRFNTLLEPAVKLIIEIKDKHPDEFARFLQFYKAELEDAHLRQYLSIFSDYFKIHTQLSQVIIHARISDESVDDKIVGSKSFENVKLYYGQAYESITSFFVVFACLNNIYFGRAFDQFQSMTLNK